MNLNQIFTFKNTKVQINDNKINWNHGWNHDTGLLIIKTWGKKWVKKISVQLGFSSEIKVPQLGLARNFPSSARLELENSSSGSSLLITWLRLMQSLQKLLKKLWMTLRVVMIWIDWIRSKELISQTDKSVLQKQHTD